MPDPLVSVILPVYNVAAFVREALESVVSQSWRDLEVILIDDGSVDATVPEVEQVHDERIVLVRKEHRGLAAARNTGLRAARGKWIAFMDGDDVWLPGKLAEDVAYLGDHADADVIFSAMSLVDVDGRDLERTVRRWSGVLTLRDLLVEDMIGNPTVLARREPCDRAGFFDEDLPVASDFDYWLRVALLRPGNLHGSPRISALYRRRPGQLTRNWKEHERVWLMIMARMRSRCPDDVQAVFHRAAANQYRGLSASAYENGEVRTAVRLFVKAMGYAPFFMLRDRRTWLLGSAIVARCVLPGRAYRWLEGIAKRILASLSAAARTRSSGPDASLARNPASPALVQRRP